MPRRTKPRKHNNRSKKRRNTNSRRSRCSIMPKSYRVRLNWSDDLTITSLSSWRFGLAQFWNQIPGYYTEYMKIYKLSRIISLRVNCTVINTTANTPAEIVSCVLPFSDYSKTLAQVKQLPGFKQKFISGSGGIDKGSVTHSANLNQWLGVDSRSIRDYQQSASEAASTLALLPDTPVLAVYVGGAATEPTLRVFLKVQYCVEFFEPEYPGSVTRPGPAPCDMTDQFDPYQPSNYMERRHDDSNDYDEGTCEKEASFVRMPQQASNRLTSMVAFEGPTKPLRARPKNT